MTQEYRINTKFLSMIKPIAPFAILKHIASVQDDTLLGRYNKLCQKFFGLISKENHNPDSYLECYHQAELLFADTKSDISGREIRYQELSEAPKSLMGDAKREALREMLSFRAEKLKLDKESNDLKKNIYDILLQIHEIFVIPPKEISESLFKMSGESGGYNEEVSFCNNLFSKKRNNGSNDFSDLLKAKEIAESHPEVINPIEKCYLYMNLAYAYEVFDYSKSLEYIKIAETFGDFSADEIIESKASYNLSLMNKDEFKKFFYQIKNVQKKLELLSDFKRSFPNDNSLKIKLTSIKGARASEEKVMQGDLKRIAMSKTVGGSKDKIKDVFFKLMSTDSALSAQKYLASTLVSIKSSSNSLEFLHEVNEKYPHLRESSIFNPNLLIAEIFVFQRNNLFKDAVEKLHILEEKLAPYGENIKSIIQHLNREKLSLFYNLVSNLELDLAESIIAYLPEDDREAITILFGKIKDLVLPEKKSQLHIDEEKSSLEDRGQKKEELEELLKINLPSNAVEFTEQVSLGSIPIEVLSGKLAHAYFMCKRSISMLESLSASGSKSEISWNIDESNEYLYPSQESQKVVKMHSVPNHYITIDPNLESELDQAERDACMKVLEMGRAAGNKGKAGVKLLNGKLYELKILGEFGDLRLIANTVYDSDGNRLIIFNKKINHDGVKAALKDSSKIHVEYLDKEKADSSESAATSKNQDIFVECQDYYTQILSEEGDILLVGESNIDF